MKKWTKLPHGLSWDKIRESMREKRRKKEFYRKLKEGERRTDDPGPMRVTGSTGPM